MCMAIVQHVFWIHLSLVQSIFLFSAKSVRLQHNKHVHLLFGGWLRKLPKKNKTKEKSFFTNFISSRDGPEKSTHTRQSWKNASRIPYICCTRTRRVVSLWYTYVISALFRTFFMSLSTWNEILHKHLLVQERKRKANSLYIAHPLSDLLTNTPHPHPVLPLSICMFTYRPDGLQVGINFGLYLKDIEHGIWQWWFTSHTHAVYMNMYSSHLLYFVKFWHKNISGKIISNKQSFGIF